ncbi:MAG: class I SAM-dependent methyltransferase [Endomicrobiaceae bacterium]|nr:class I SAM-dependent methyltransferase [Endomicrobiaceae bacterium]
MKKHEHSGCARKTLENPKEILIKAGLKRGNDVLLDIGTGSGYLAFLSAEIMGNGSTVYAVDSHEETIKTLNKQLSEKEIKNVFAIKADAVNEIPVKRDTVDICLMSNVVHGFVPNNEMEKVLQNLNTVLKDNGKLIIIDFNKNDTSFGPPSEIRVNSDEVEEIIAPYGYELTNSFDDGRSQYCVVFKKVCLQDKWC